MSGLPPRVPAVRAEQCNGGEIPVSRERTAVLAVGAGQLEAKCGARVAHAGIYRTQGMLAIGGLSALAAEQSLATDPVIGVPIRTIGGHLTRRAAA